MAVHVERSTQQTALVRFSLPESEDPSTVSVVGSFNDWTPGAHQFTQDRDDDEWSVMIEVPYGDEVHFRYLAEGGRWFDDPDASVYGDDGGRITATEPREPDPVEDENEEPAKGSEIMSENEARSGTPDIPGDTPPASAPAPAPEPQEREPGRDSRNPDSESPGDPGEGEETPPREDSSDR